METMLSPSLREALHAQLMHDHNQLREQIADLRRAEGLDQPLGSLERDGEVTDQADEGMDQAEWDRMRIEELALTDRLAEVDHALAKFLAGTYGLCEMCGRPIPEARLRALPEARFDIEHQAAFERSIHAEEGLLESRF